MIKLRSTEQSLASLDDWMRGISPRAELLQLNHPLASSEEALADLLRHLACATMLLEDSSDGGRSAAHRSLMAIKEFGSVRVLYALVLSLGPHGRYGHGSQGISGLVVGNR